nr:NADH dehydrogenase subunit 2 [Dimorphopteryx sp. 1 GYN-2021]
MTKMLLINNNNKMLNKLSLMKFIFYMLLILSSLLAINSSSWFMIWMSMELNLMFFLPIMMTNFSMKNNISKSMMLYFIVQASSSALMLYFIIMMKMNFILMNLNTILTILQISILIKLGASPFHWWMPKMMPNLNWMNNFILLTWQKIAPMFLLTQMNNNFIIYLSAILSTFMGAILGMNQISIKLIISYSSINHLGWMLMTIMLNKFITLIYFLIYTMINFMICLMMNNLNLTYLNQLFKNFNQNMFMKLIIISLFLSLSGLPPFIGFLSKFFIITIMMKNLMIMETIFFIILATITLSYYINPMLSMFIFNKQNIKWNNKINILNIFLTNILLINMILILMIITPIMMYL